MVSSRAATVADYLAELPADRREAIEAVRRTIARNVPRGFEERMQYGMISWVVPESRFSATYNGQPLALASLGSQKGYMALYLMSVYGDEALTRWLQAEFRKAGKKLDMGKSCLRFKSLADLPMDVLGALVQKVGVDELVARHEEARAGRSTAKRTAKKPAGKKAAAKKPAAKKPAAKKPAAKRPAAKKPARATR